jgi:predicted phage tail protein
MSDMTEKYQQHYNKILTGTLTDTILKGVSYQANIQLANEIIAEQEKTILDLQTNADTSKKELQSTVDKELEEAKNNKASVENNKIFGLESTIKNQQSTISKLQSDLYEANKLRTEYENVKHQVQHLDTYRNEVIKANEIIEALKEEKTSLVSKYEGQIEKLKNVDPDLKTPVNVKKTKAKKPVATVSKAKATTTAKIIKQDLPNLIVKDGGSF